MRNFSFYLLINNNRCSISKIDKNMVVGVGPRAGMDVLAVSCQLLGPECITPCPSLTLPLLSNI